VSSAEAACCFYRNACIGKLCAHNKKLADLSAANQEIDLMSPAIRLTLRILESIGLAFGPALIALNLFSFIPTRNGYAFSAGAEWGIASGVFLVSLAIIARKWNR
jgi:hypothetical protein